MIIKLTGAAVAAVLSMTALAACGGGSDNASGGSGYCTDLKAAKANLSGLNSVDQLTGEKYQELSDAVHTIAGEAPADVKGSWTLIDNQLTLLQNAMKDAGLSMDDFAKLAQGQNPPNVDPSKLPALLSKLKSFDSTGLDTASTKIQNEVKSECHFDLESTS
jgi:hypothetical protein